MSQEKASEGLKEGNEDSQFRDSMTREKKRKLKLTHGLPAAPTKIRFNDS